MTKTELTLDLRDLDAIRARALDCAIDQALRQYFAKHTSPGVDLPFDNPAGAQPNSGVSIGTVFYTPAPDVARRLPTHKEAVTHIRAACREFINYRPEPDVIRPIPPKPDPTIEIICSGKVKAAAQASAKARGMSLEDLTVEIADAFYVSLGSNRADWRGTGKYPGAVFGDTTDYTTGFRLRVKPGLRGRLPGDLAEFISVAMDRKFGDQW